MAGRNLPGTSYNSRAAKWQARIAVAGVRKHLGYFDTPEAACAAYKAAKAKQGDGRRTRRHVARAPRSDLGALVERAAAGMLLSILDRMQDPRDPVSLHIAAREVASRILITDLI